MTLPTTPEGKELFADGEYHHAGCLLNIPDGHYCDCPLPDRLDEIEKEARQQERNAIRAAVALLPKHTGRTSGSASHANPFIYDWDLRAILDAREKQ
jgi:hypothetical protein